MRIGHLGGSIGTVVSATVLAIGLLAGQAVAQNYTVTQIPSLGGAETYVMGLNDVGQVVGRGWLNGFSNMRAYKWSASTGTVNLGTLPGGGDSEAWEINNDGVVCGMAINSSGRRRAVKWVGNVITDLGTLGGNESGALGINDHGDIVGFAETGALDSNGYPIRHAVEWPAGSGIVDLGTRGSDVHSYAYDINNYGVACGYSQGPLGGPFVRYPVKFENGGVQYLGSLGGTFGHAWAINDRNEISGDSYLAGNSITRGYKWVDNVMHDVGTLRSGYYSIPLDINVFGQMAGISGGIAVRWVGPNSTIQNINNYLPNGSPRMDTAEGVNGVGQIVVEDTHASCYLLTPPQTQLPLYGPDPGIAGVNNSLTVYGATPGQLVRFYYSLRSGSTGIPGCPGLSLDISTIHLAGTATANSVGRASIVGYTPSGAGGRVVRYQALEYSSCRKSNRVDYRY